MNKKLDVKNIGDKLKRVEAELVNMEKEKARLEGKRDEIVRQIKEEFGVGNIEEAEKLLMEKESLMLKESKALEELQEKLDSLMEKRSE